MNVSRNTDVSLDQTSTLPTNNDGMQSIIKRRRKLKVNWCETPEPEKKKPIAQNK